MTGKVIRFPTRTEAPWLEVWADGDEVCFSIAQRIANDECFGLPADDARKIAAMFSEAAYKAREFARNRADADGGFVRAALFGTSRDGSPHYAAYVRAQIVDRGPFVARLRVEGSGDGLYTKHKGVEFTVHNATGEDVGRMPHRRWWQVDAEHVGRLRAEEAK